MEDYSIDDILIRLITYMKLVHLIFLLFIISVEYNPLQDTSLHIVKIHSYISKFDITNTGNFKGLSHSFCFPFLDKFCTNRCALYSIFSLSELH